MLKVFPFEKMSWLEPSSPNFISFELLARTSFSEGELVPMPNPVSVSRIRSEPSVLNVV